MTRRLLAISLLTALAAGCKKEKKQDPYITAKAGIYDFYASGGRVASSTQKYSSYTSATVEGATSDGAMITLWIRDFTGKLESYQLDSTQGAATYRPPTPSVDNPAVRGNLHILSVTPRLRGIFQFKCADSIEVIGSFDVDPI